MAAGLLWLLLGLSVLYLIGVLVTIWNARSTENGAPPAPPVADDQSAGSSETAGPPVDED